MKLFCKTRATGPRLIFPISALKMELFTTPNTQSVSTLLIIFVRLFKNAQMQVEICEIPLAGASEIPCKERIYAFPTVLLPAATGLPRA